MENWTFPELNYERPDVEKVTGMLRAYTERVKTAKSGQEVIDAVLEQNREMAPITDMLTLCSVRHTLNTADEFYDAENAWMEQTMPTLMPDMLVFTAALEQSPFRPELEERFGREYFAGMELQRKSFCEKNIPLM